MVIALLAILLALPAAADTYLVNPDGSGDFTTIQDAIHAAADEDTIELACDVVYRGQGNRDIDYLGKAMTVRSECGDPQRCTIDCEGTISEPHRGFYFHSGEGPASALESVTITGGCTGGNLFGGAIFCSGASPSITNCIFQRNYADYGGGVCCLSYSAPILLDCAFYENSAGDSGVGGGFDCDGSSPILINCAFYGNSAGWGGGIKCSSSNCQLSGCVVADNQALPGGGVACIWSTLIAGNCTLARNRGGGIECDLGSSAYLDRTIIAFSLEGAALLCHYDATATLTCCDVYGNEGGDWIDCIEDQALINGNFHEDPLFCGDTSPDYPLNLRPDSPCAPGNHPYGWDCGLIGACDVGCPPAGVEEETAPVAALRLAVATPNPFELWTRIAYTVPAGTPDSWVLLCVYDAAGRRIRTLVDASLPAGTYNVTWDGTTDSGVAASAGVYFCRFEVMGEGLTQRIALMR
jgi:hypothetical protein